MDYILILGAKSDIAKALAKKYAENGYNLYLAARKSSDLENFTKKINPINEKNEKVMPRSPVNNLSESSP